VWKLLEPTTTNVLSASRGKLEWLITAIKSRY
jgi:hypothetical protein